MGEEKDEKESAGSLFYTGREKTTEGMIWATSRHVVWRVIASTAFALAALVLLCLVGCSPPRSIPTPTPTKTARPLVTLPPTPDLSVIQIQAAEDVIATLTAQAPSPTPTPEPPTPTPTQTPSPTPLKTGTVSADDEFVASLADFQDDMEYLGAQFDLLAEHLADEDALAMCRLADEVHPRAVAIMEKSFDMPNPQDSLLCKAQEHLWDTLIAWATSWANLKNGFCQMFDPWYLEGVTGQLEIGNDHFLEYNHLLEEYREVHGE